MPETEAYGPRLLRSIKAQCEARNIPEPEAVVAEIEEAAGKGLREMNVSELQRVQRNLGAHFDRFLDGRKRMGESAPTAW